MSKTMPALQGQPSENSEDFVVNQDAIIPNLEPATIKPSFSNNSNNGK